MKNLTVLALVLSGCTAASDTITLQSLRTERAALAEIYLELAAAPETPPEKLSVIGDRLVTMLAEIREMAHDVGESTHADAKEWWGLASQILMSGLVGIAASGGL